MLVIKEGRALGDKNVDFFFKSLFLLSQRNGLFARL
jgi:hypothetical protein